MLKSPRIHELKTWPEFYTALESRAKTFEVRRNDRGYQVGDGLLLQEFDPASGYTGRELYRGVTYVLPGGAFGIEPEWCVLGLSVHG